MHIVNIKALTALDSFAGLARIVINHIDACKISLQVTITSLSTSWWGITACWQAAIRLTASYIRRTYIWLGPTLHNWSTWHSMHDRNHAQCRWRWHSYTHTYTHIQTHQTRTHTQTHCNHIAIMPNANEVGWHLYTYALTHKHIHTYTITSQFCPTLMSLRQLKRAKKLIWGWGRPSRASKLCCSRCECEQDWCQSCYLCVPKISTALAFVGHIARLTKLATNALNHFHLTLKLAWTIYILSIYREWHKQYSRPDFLSHPWPP